MFVNFRNPNETTAVEQLELNHESTLASHHPEKIDPKTFFQELANATKSIQNHLLHPLSCRFADIPCPEETHIKMPGENHMIFMHANRVELEDCNFIAAQYPLCDLFDPPQLIEFFWNEMCTDCLMIVDLTNDADMDKGLTAYAPVLGETKTFGTVTVSCINKESIEGLAAFFFTYEITSDIHKEPKKVIRLHSKEWQDHAGISVETFDKLVCLIAQKLDESDKPILTHCRAGVGRTGTAITAAVLKKLIEEGKVTFENLKEEMTKIILSGRKQRGKAFVQSEAQLKTLCEWANYTLEKMQKHN